MSPEDRDLYTRLTNALLCVSATNARIEQALLERATARVSWPTVGLCLAAAIIVACVRP